MTAAGGGGDDDDYYIFHGALLDSRCALGLTESRETYEHDQEQDKFYAASPATLKNGGE